MRSILTVVALAGLSLVGCSNNDGNSVGNGPGDADGAGNRSDPPTATSAQDPSASGGPASTNTPNETTPPPTDTNTAEPDDHNQHK
jgi:hypothetical protein